MTSAGFMASVCGLTAECRGPGSALEPCARYKTATLRSARRREALLRPQSERGWRPSVVDCDAVCLLAAYCGPNSPLARAMDSR